MRSHDPAVPDGAGVDRALALGVCGIGGLLHPPPREIEDAVATARVQHGRRLAARLRRFAAVPEGEAVWTQDLDGLIHRGELRGPWRYDGTAPAARVDLVHVRDCAWSVATEVPDAVLDAFARGGRNFQRIRALG